MTSQTIPIFTVGDRMRKARDHAGLSSAEMADSLRARGIRAQGSQTVTNWERDANQPRDLLTTLEAWADITGVPLWWLITGSDLPERGYTWNLAAA